MIGTGLPCHPPALYASMPDAWWLVAILTAICSPLAADLPNLRGAVED